MFNVSIFYFLLLSTYAVNSTPVIVKVTQNGGSNLTVYNAPTINEYPQTVSITVQKVDKETGKTVPQGHGSFEGAVYEVVRYTQNPYSMEKVGTITLDKTGKGTLEGLEPGEYKVQEIKAPNGYILSDEVLTVNAAIKEENTANFNYVVKAKETPTTLEVKKLDSEKNLVAGAKMQLLDSNGNVVEEWTRLLTNIIICVIIMLSVTTNSSIQPKRDVSHLNILTKTFPVKPLTALRDSQDLPLGKSCHLKYLEVSE